ncbi:MAG TPA: cupin domain-containing protein [Methylibium sp.]|nr:cupin domain-containing protein [Methylibium sp.]
MDARAHELIATLGLQPHPEGGHYREIYRAAAPVSRPADGALRAALTVIHFLLLRGASSRWHQVQADEVWQYIEGAPLQLCEFPAGGGGGRRSTLGPLAPGQAPVHVVPAGHWQAAQTLGDYTLLACTVAPGFDFADFRLLAEQPEGAVAAPENLPFWRALL